MRYNFEFFMHERISDFAFKIKPNEAYDKMFAELRFKFNASAA